MSTPTLKFLFLIAPLLLIGCDPVPKTDYSSMDLVNVSGTVTLDDQPLKGANVVFQDPVSKIYSYGKTDSSGKYSLRFDSVMMGVPTGEKIVRITTVGNPGGEGGEEAPVGEGGGDEEAAPKTETLPARYHENSELKVTVTESERTFDFDLDSTPDPEPQDGDE